MTAAQQQPEMSAATAARDASPEGDRQQDCPEVV